jgi:hypothetical protein
MYAKFSNAICRQTKLYDSRSAAVQFKCGLTTNFLKVKIYALLQDFYARRTKRPEVGRGNSLSNMTR